jgi:hypothetical protein
MDRAFVTSLGDIIGGNLAVTGATGPGFVFPPFSLTVVICGTFLESGNIEVRKSGGGSVVVGSQTGFPCSGNDVENGNIRVEDNFVSPPFALSVGRNTVGGNVQVFRNRGPGGKFVVENVVRQNLQCRRNDQPFVGAPNVAAQAEGQCSAVPPPGM